MKKLIAKFTFFLVYMVLFAASAEGEENTYRSNLTGDWNGIRSTLSDHGLNIQLEYTSTYQGLISDDQPSNARYGGKWDAFCSVDTEKAGLWQNGAFVAHLEYAHADATTFFSRTVFPFNMAMMTPVGDPKSLEATSLYYLHTFSDDSRLMIGKINSLDLLADDAFFGGWGTQRFMHLAFVAPPSGVVPAVFIGAVYSFDTGPYSWTLMLFDPEDRSLEYFPDDLFSEGVNMGVALGHETTWYGRKTEYSINITYSTQKGTDLSQITSGVTTSKKKGSYNISLQLSHNLQQNDEGSWGLYAKASIADGNPNTIKGFFIGGIGGDALFFDRPQDRFGIGVFYYDFSDVLQDALRPDILFDDEWGIEAYYNYELTPWFHITADLQYVHPADGTENNVFVGGLRTNIKF
jgi:porin